MQPCFWLQYRIHEIHIPTFFPELLRTCSVMSMRTENPQFSEVPFCGTLLWAVLWFLVLVCVAVCNEDYPCEGMSRHATFENFGMAFLTLFQVSTGDNWNGIMKVLWVLLSSFWELFIKKKTLLYHPYTSFLSSYIFFYFCLNFSFTIGGGKKESGAKSKKWLSSCLCAQHQPDSKYINE